MILPYLDVPLQHANSRILKAMKRPASSENTLARIESWREICPEITLRSTFIVGFPGETEEEFEELLDFLEEAQLDRVGCFKYSPVEGAKANELAIPCLKTSKKNVIIGLCNYKHTSVEINLENKIGSTQTVLGRRNNSNNTS